jgi:hypothetical protein
LDTNNNFGAHTFSCSQKSIGKIIFSFSDFFFYLQKKLFDTLNRAYSGGKTEENARGKTEAHARGPF